MNIIHRMKQMLDWNDPAMFILTPPDHENFVKSCENMKLDLKPCEAGGVTCRELRGIPVAVNGRFLDSFAVVADTRMLCRIYAI